MRSPFFELLNADTVSQATVSAGIFSLTDVVSAYNDLFHLGSPPFVLECCLRAQPRLQPNLCIDYYLG